MIKEEDIRPSDLVKLQQKCLEEDIEMLKKKRAKFVTVSCVACGSSENRAEHEKNGFTYVKCEKCGTLFMNPRPDLETLNEFYKNSKNYKFWSENIFPKTEASRRENIVKPRVDRILEICKKHKVTTETIVEIGSAFGSFCEEMISRETFKKVIAVEPTPDLANVCRKKNIQVIESIVELIPKEELQANVIVSFEVIEHLFDPKSFLQAMKKNISNNGLLVLSCPNGEGFEMLEMGVFSSTLEHEHLNYFNVGSLSLLMQETGYEILEVLTPGLLDADIVRKGIEDGVIKGSPFLKKILVEEWDKNGDNFQKYLQENLLSTHMWIVAKNKIIN